VSETNRDLCGRTRETRKIVEESSSVIPARRDPTADEQTGKTGGGTVFRSTQ